MKNCLYLCLLFLLPISLMGQKDLDIAQVTVLMQNQSKFIGVLEVDLPGKIHLNIDGEMYVIPKNEIVAVIPSEILAESVEKDVLKKDLLVLKNKIWISGEVLEIGSKTVYFKTGSTTHFMKLNEIEKIFLKGQEVSFLSRTRDQVEYTEPLIIAKLKRQFTKDGFYHIVYGDLGFSSGLGVQYSFGYQFSRLMGLGVGVGYHDTLSGSFFRRPKFIPVYAEVRGYTSEMKTSFYYNLALGLTTGTTVRDGTPAQVSPRLYTHPAVGYKFGSDRVAFLVDLGLQLSSAEYNFEIIPTGTGLNQREVLESNSVVLRFGIMF